MIQKSSRLRNWWVRFLHRIRWGFLLIILGSFIYIVLYYFRHEINRVFGLQPSSFIKLVASAINNFLQHYFPDLVAAGTIYLFIDEGLKVLIGTREEKQRVNSKVVRYFRKAENEIHILDTFINNFILEVTEEKFKELILNRIEKGVKVKILLLNPDSDAAQQRVNDLSNSPPYLNSKRKIGSEIFHKTVFLFKIYEEVNKRSKRENDPLYKKGHFLNIKLYDRTPPMVYYAWDDTAYFSLITPDSLTERNPNLVISKLTLFGRYTSNIFEKIWSAQMNAPTIDINRYMIAHLYEEMLEISEVPKYENIIYFGFKEGMLRDLPHYIIIRNVHNNLFNYLSKCIGKTVRLEYHGRPYSVKVKTIIKHYPDLQRYTEIMMLINKFYDLDKQASLSQFGRNQPIFEVEFTESE